MIRSTLKEKLKVSNMDHLQNSQYREWLLPRFFHISITFAICTTDLCIYTLYITGYNIFL